ncbi:DUF561 domain-containing protein, partial [Tanacetum coccineum]
VMILFKGLRKFIPSVLKILAAIRTTIPSLTMETRRCLPLVTLCVAVPHTLSLSDQAKLAKHLEQEGADIIQTQGGK